MILLYPSDYFNRNQVEEMYQEEYRAASNISDMTVLLFSYDEFIETGEIKLYPKKLVQGIGIYRGWMLNSEQYQVFYNSLLAKGIQLINTPEQYTYCHEFPNVYAAIEKITPKIKIFRENEKINWKEVKKEFGRFMIKDFVKSVKGTKFPVYFDETYSEEELDYYMFLFKEMRGNLFTKGIVIKQFVTLADYNQKTNEYRVFYLGKQAISISKNSEQSQTCKEPPSTLINQVIHLKSNFYTVDFAELEDGNFVVIETGDGQVSGLSKGQNVEQFYEQLKNYTFNEKGKYK